MGHEAWVAHSCPIPHAPCRVAQSGPCRRYNAHSPSGGILNALRGLSRVRRVHRRSCLQMAELNLEVTRREGTGKGIARRLRVDGKVPAVVYGAHREAVPITVDRKAITELIQKS